MLQKYIKPARILTFNNKKEHETSGLEIHTDLKSEWSSLGTVL